MAYKWFAQELNPASGKWCPVFLYHQPIIDTKTSRVKKTSGGLGNKIRDITKIIGDGLNMSLDEVNELHGTKD